MDDYARGEEFLSLYNEVDHFLKKKVGIKGSVPFWKRVRIGSSKYPALKRYMDDLLEIHELRNAIVHHRAYPKELIAIPTDDVINKLRLIVDALISPPTVMPRFEREIHVFDAADPLSNALKYMNKQQFRQIAVREGGKLRLVTDAGIARWLLSRVHDESLNLSDAVVGDVLPFELDGSMAIIPSHFTIDEARAVFEQTYASNPRKLFAIVITKTGKPDEKPLGIITPRELLAAE